MKLFCAPGTLSLLPHIVFLEAEVPFTAIRINEHTKAIEGGGDYRTVNPLGSGLGSHENARAVLTASQFW
ncbi:hypothetical protein [Bradyrhizobium acaciae]|uniref:hypothetical protein n=1 Tax=Bradyrhizobium acaciae TaxID=2683706 RepID=UPI001E3E3A34|nr:hypothetical protein [Bradyrhizobium acaciae]MCC8984207.1 hypothetical protein [Bradyrhizobium acaciae]